MKTAARRPLFNVRTKPHANVGTVRVRRPVARANAFNTAGAATQIVGSPTPPEVHQGRVPL